MKSARLTLGIIASSACFGLVLSVPAAMTTVESFESYPTSVELGAAWTAAAGAPVVALETSTVCGGTRAMAVAYSGGAAPFTNLVKLTFGSNQNWTSNTVFTFNYGGLTNSSDDVVVQFVDQFGAVLGTRQIAGGTLNPPCSLATVDISNGKAFTNAANGTGLQSVRGIQLGVVANTANHAGTVYFDNLAVGNRGVLSVLGSSVALGIGSSGNANNQFINGSYSNGYAADLTIAEATNGWRVVNQSVGGDTTASVINRFYTDEVPVHADQDLIALSLGNEGLPGAANPQAIYNQFFTGITNLIAMSRSNNIVPLLGNQYPRDPYTTNEYAYLKNMDLLANTLNVPSVNFLGATDDGLGHWINNSFINLGSGDGVHPNDAGHYEMYLTIVPSVFDAVKAGKPIPTWGNNAKFLRITGDAAQAAPLGFNPSLIMHSFTVSFRVRSAATGTVASITLPSSSVHPTIEITPTGLAYVGTNGVVNNSGVSGTNGVWHYVVVAHAWARGQTWFYVDGALAGTVAERLTPVGFVLGGQGSAVTRPGSPAQADYQNWLVHRSLMNAEEVSAQYQGKFQQASLELYAALDDNSFSQGVAVTNRAQSLSSALINGTSSDYQSALTIPAPSNLAAVTNYTPAVILSWIDPSADAEDAYYVDRNIGGGAWTNIAILAAHATNYVDTAVGVGTNYQYRVSYSQGGVRSDFSASLGVLIPVNPQFATFTNWISHYYPSRQPDILLDFDNGTPNYNGQIWNTISDPSDTTTVYSLVDSNGLYTGISAQLLTAFPQTRTDTSGALGVYPASAEMTMFVGNTSPASVVKFTGMNTNYAYRFTFLSHRGNPTSGNNYVGLFTFAGANTNSATVNCSNNTVFATIPAVIPDATGAVTLSVTTNFNAGGGNPYPMLNLVEIRALWPQPAVPATVALDFDDVTLQAYPSYGRQIWNTVTNSSASVIYSLVDTNGWPSGYTARMSIAFDQTRTDTSVGIFPAAAEQSLFASRDSANKMGQITFSNLNTSATYDFTFLAHRGSLVSGYDYMGNYTFAGATTNYIMVQASNNVTPTVVQGIIPSASGVITLTVATNNINFVLVSGTSYMPVINLAQLTTVPASARTNVLIDFNPGGTTTSPDAKGRYWNSLTSGTAGTTLSNLKNQYNQNSGVSLQLVRGFNANRTGNIVNGEYPTTSESTLLCNDSGVAGWTNSQILFSGLNPSTAYDFKFFASRTAVSGWDYWNSYTFTGLSTYKVIVNASNNTSMAWAPGIYPNASGQITLDFSVVTNSAASRMELINMLQFSPSLLAPTNPIPTDPTGFANDPDGDGLNNQTEYILNTSPTNANARFDLSNIAAGSNGAVALTWSSVQNGGGFTRAYDVYKSDGSPNGFGPWSLLAGGIPPGGVTTTISDDASTVTQRLYRVVISGLPLSSTVKTLKIAGVQSFQANEGRTLLGCSLLPATNTLPGIFGTNLPAGAVQSSATAVDLWDQASQNLTNRYWLSSAAGFGGWRRLDFTDAGTDNLDPNKGLILTMRHGIGISNLYLSGWMLQTNQTQVLPSNGWALVSSTFPVSVPLPNSGLLASGFIGGANMAASDEVIFFNPQLQHFDTTNWYDTIGGVWRDQNSNVATNQLQPGVAFEIYRRNRTANLIWTNPIPVSVQTLMQ